MFFFVVFFRGFFFCFFFKETRGKVFMEVLSLSFIGPSAKNSQAFRTQALMSAE